MGNADNFVGPNGNTVKNTNVDAFSIILKISKTATLLTWIILPILYYVFYFKSDVPDLFHILDSNEVAFNRCFNVSIITNNLKDIYDTIKDFVDGVQRY